MRDKLSALLGISSEEGLKVTMLLTQSVFIGIFIGAFDITAYSLFLSTFDEKLMAPGFVVSGVGGLIITALYLKLRSKADPRKFAIVNLIFLVLITTSLWLAISYSPRTWLIFLVFVLLGPLNILSFLGFRGTIEKIFKSNPDKILSFLENGYISGVLIISFLIPLILVFKIHTHNILIISILSAIVVMIMQILINKKMYFTAEAGDEDTGNIIKRFPLFVKKDPYLRTLGLFAGLSVLAAFLIQYTFMAVARKQFPVSEDLASFLGFFTGIMMIFTLFVKFAVFPYLIHNFRLKFCLLVSPVLIACLSVLAIVSGFLAEAAGGFTIIMLIMGFNRLVSKSFKDSVELLSYKTLYHSISKMIRPGIKSGIDGTLNEMGLIFSGVVLAGFGFLSFVKIIHFSELLLIISLIWIFTGVKLIQKYRASLKRVSVDDLSGSDPVPVLKNKFASGLEFRKDYFGIISGKYSALNNITASYLEELSTYALTKNDLNLLPALRKIAGNTSFESTIRQRSQEIIENLSKKDVAADEGIRLLSGTRLPQTTEILRLLRNSSLDSKRLAIHMIGKFRISDLLSVVCESLNTPGLSQDAYEILLSFGDGVEDELVRFYLINSGNLKLSRIILQILGNTCTKDSTGFLFSHLWSNSRQIKEVSIKSLLKCKFKPSGEEFKRVDNLIIDTIGTITWNMGAEMILEKEKNEFLLKIIKQENERWMTFLFNVLSLNYGKDVIGIVMNAFSEHSIEGTAHALEILRGVVSDSIMPVLVVILDDLPLKSKLKKLSGYYPSEVSGHKNLAEDLINRDYNLMSLWTKACTLRSINKIEGNEMAESVTALLFSPEEIITEEAAYLIGRSNPDLYISASDRISGQVKKKLDKILNGVSDKKEMLFEKVKFLEECFPDIPVWELFTLAGDLQYISDSGSDFGECEEGCILWVLNKENNISDVQIIYNGAVRALNDRLKEVKNLSVYRLPLASVKEFHFQYPDHSHLILVYVDKMQESS